MQSLQLNQALLANPSAPIRGLVANSSRNVPARVPVVGFSSTGLNTVTANGHSSYNAFVSTLSRRMDRSFLQLAYTYSKSIRFGEKIGLQLRGDAYNVLNHPIFNISNTSGTTLTPAAAMVGGSQFGRINSTVTNARILNIAVKITF